MEIQSVRLFAEEETDPEKRGVRAACGITVKDRFGQVHHTKSYILLEPGDFYCEPAVGETSEMAEKRTMRAIIKLISDQVLLAWHEAKDIVSNV